MRKEGKVLRKRQSDDKDDGGEEGDDKHDDGEDFGVFRISAFRGHNSYQITCRHPHHPGRTKRSFCTKTRSCLKDGGDPAITKRLLKTWAVWGYDKDSKDSHAEVWPEVLEAHEAGDLPTDEALEEQVIHDWSELGMSEKKPRVLALMSQLC